MTPRRLIVWCLVLVALSACRRGNAESGQATSAAPLAVAMAVVSTESITETVEATGTLAAWQEATVSLEVEGRVAELAVDLGDAVGKGATLARVIPVEFTWRKAQADADLAAAEADFRRLEEMAGRNLVSKQQLDESRRRLEVSRAASDLADKKLADTAVRAPFAGQIAARLINVGEYVRAGTPAFVVVQSNPLKLEAEVPERFANVVAAGDAVSARIASSAAPLTGELTRIGPAISPATRAFPVEAKIDNSGGLARPGAFARVEITTATHREALVVPEQAVRLFAGSPRVFLLVDGKVKETPIRVSGKSRDRVWVESGLEAGQKVAVTAVDRLTDGRAVTERPTGEREARAPTTAPPEGRP
jgi:RND family efflux transporter MFP subunit